MRARVEALRSAARREPSWERTWREMVMVECGYRFVKRVEEKVEEMVVCISPMRLVNHVSV